MFAIYLRKSRAEEANSSTDEVLLKHHEALLELAARKGISIDDEYKEVVSGESLAARPQMLRLLERVRAGDYDAVLCMDIDRLGRGGMADQGVILDAFRLSDTLIITPDKTYDLSDEMDEELTEFKAFMARREYKIIRKRMRRGLMQTVEDGGYIANAPYGYEKCTVDKKPSLRIVPEQAKFIRYIFERYISGVGAATIAEELNAMGSVPNRNASWNRNTVRHILRNPTFAGKIAWNRVKHIRKSENGVVHNTCVYQPESEWLLVDGLHPAIISWETFQAAKEVRVGRYIPSKKDGHTKNPLAGLIVCSRCGFNLQQMISKGEYYIHCTTRDCQAGAKTEYVEEAVIAALNDQLDSMRLSSCAAESTGELPAVEASLAATIKDIGKLETRLPRLYEFLEDGTYTKEIFTQRLSAAENEKAALLKKQDDLEKQITDLRALDTRKTALQLETVLALYPTLNAEEKNNLLKTIIDHIDYTKVKKSKPRDLSVTIHLKHIF